MFLFQILLFSSVPLTVCGQVTTLQFEADGLNSELSQLLDDLIETKMEKITKENNIKIFAQMEKQNQRIIDLELKFDQ